MYCARTKSCSPWVEPVACAGCGLGLHTARLAKERNIACFRYDAGYLYVLSHRSDEHDRDDHQCGCGGSTRLITSKQVTLSTLAV